MEAQSVAKYMQVEQDSAKASAKLKFYEEYSEETDEMSVKSRHLKITWK